MTRVCVGTQKIVTRLRKLRGMPTIFVNGHPIHGGFVGTRGGSHFLKARPEGVMPLTWMGTDWQMLLIGPGGTFDLERLVEGMAHLFKRNSRALGGVILGLRPNRDWVAAHPCEMPVAAWPIDWMTDPRPDASWASQVWRKDSVAFVESVARRLHDEFKGRVIFYQVGGGRCAENSPQIVIDSSEPMLRHLRDWLRKRYHDDVGRLRRYWSDPKVTFETATPPDHAERLTTEWFAFRSPFRRRTGDYLAALSECVEHNVLLWSAAIKRATRGEALAVSPAAKCLDAGLYMDAHAGMTKNTVRGYLVSPHLDIVQSAASYTYRDLGRGDTTFLQPMGSVQLAGKMHMRDFDERTHLTAWKGEEFPKCRLWQPPADAWGDEQLLIRSAAYSLLKGGAFWWHELEKGMYQLPSHIQTARRLQAVGRGIVWTDRRMSAKGMAIFVDPESHYLLSSSNRLIFAMNYEARQLQWAHAGMASNIFCIEDAKHPGMPSPKVIMVTNAFVMTTAQADAVKALARKNRATLIWLTAPGVQTSHGFDLEQTRRITGFKVRALDVETLPRITMTPNGLRLAGSLLGQNAVVPLPKGTPVHGGHPWSHVRWDSEIPKASFGGGPFDADDAAARGIGPTFYVDTAGDPAVHILGELDSINQPGLVAREMDGYTSVYCAAPYLHKALLRQIGKDSGAHLYLDTDDLVHASRELLLINARRAGDKEVSWPSRVEVVVDLYSGRTIARNARRWTIPLRKYETRFLFAGAAAVAEKVRRGMALTWADAIGSRRVPIKDGG